MKTLYIVGNGFDLFHDLPTSYGDFHSYIKATNEKLVNDLERYFYLNSNEQNQWTKFEEDLGTFDANLFYDDICDIDIQNEDFKPSLCFSLEDDIGEQADTLIDSVRSAFEEWLELIDIEIIRPKIQLEQDSFFISFNYTLVLEQVYGIPSSKILHIHGDLNNNYGELIFGHNSVSEEIEQELDENGDSNRTPFSDSKSRSKYPKSALQKPVSDIIEKYKHLFDQLGSVERIIFLGHSLNSIDLPYFSKIFQCVYEPILDVSYYNDDEKNRYLETIKKLGAPLENVTLFKLASSSIS